MLRIKLLGLNLLLVNLITKSNEGSSESGFENDNEGVVF